MKVLVTGSAGRIGRAIYVKFTKHFSVIGVDISSAASVDFIGSITDIRFLNNIPGNIDVIVHAAALHAPHVGVKSNRDFVATNVSATKRIARWGLSRGMKHMVFISSTAVYGHAPACEGQCNWITEETLPYPRTIYHTTKLKAESWLQQFSKFAHVPVSVLRMSRCFPETADKMAVYRLHRGIDMRDVALACIKAIEGKLPGFEVFNISGTTPFSREDCAALYSNPELVLREKAPQLAQIFDVRGWQYPKSIDRVYDSNKATKLLNWQPQHDYYSVLDCLDNDIPEVLTVINRDNFRGAEGK